MYIDRYIDIYIYIYSSPEDAVRCMKMIAAFALAIRKIAPNRLWPYIGS